MNDDIDRELIAILEQLWRAKQETPGLAWSLAKLAKQSGLPMSKLRRHLTGLADAGLVDVRTSEECVGSASLMDDGWRCVWRCSEAGQDRGTLLGQSVQGRGQSVLRR